MPIDPIPARYQYAVIPHVMVNGAAAAIEFYEKALGAIELFRVAKSDGQIVHAEITVGRSVIMVGDVEDPFHAPLPSGGTTVGLHVYVDDVNACFAQAVDAGAKVIQAVQDMFYGDRVCMLEDPYGHIWVLLTHTEDLGPEEIKRGGEALLNS